MIHALGPRVRSLAALLLILALFVVFYTQANAPQQSGSVRATAIPSAADLAVYFSAPGEAARSRWSGGPESELVLAIDAAHTSIQLALYDLDLWVVRDALLRAFRRGVDVRLVVEGDNAHQPEIEDLRALGIPIVAEDRPPLMHHKFIVIDGDQVWTGSMNLTINGAYRNDNNLMRLQSADLAADYLREFEELYEERRFGELSLVDTPFPFLVVGKAAVEVAFAPEDNVLARILRRLGEAESTIEILAFVLTSDPLVEALESASAHGIQVRGVVEAARSGDQGSDVDRLRASGLDIRLDANPNNMHHKVILIDGGTVIAGSYNFTRSAEEKNDENVLLIDDRELAQRFLQEFERIYAQALP
jgi:phosphatidylserine/phosphatidylglycerophosphate/cardiolipin synthase-like enzyme